MLLCPTPTVGLQWAFCIELHYNQLHEIINWNALRSLLVYKINQDVLNTCMMDLRVVGFGCLIQGDFRE